MAAQDAGKPAKPGDGELALSKLKMADLLVRRAYGLRQLIKRESTRFAQLADPVWKVGVTPDQSGRS